MKPITYKYNKYGAAKQEYDGYNYDSRMEASQAMELDFRLKAKEFVKWERQVRLDLTAHGMHVCYYKMDFVITHHDGHKEYIEVKGMKTYAWQIKWKLLKAQLAAEEPSSIMTLVTK